MGRRAPGGGGTSRNQGFFGAIFGGRTPAELAAGAADVAGAAELAAGAALADVTTLMLAVAVTVGFAVAVVVAVAVVAAEPAEPLVSVGAADSSFLPQPTRSVIEAATISASVEIFMAGTSTRNRPPL